MKLRVLGCYGAELLGYKSVSILINDLLLIDAGNISSLTMREELVRIRHLVLSHIHLDHTKALPFLAEQLSEDGKGLEVFGTEETIESLRRHMFNGAVWPDLSRLPAVQNPAVRYMRIREGIPVSVSGLSVKAIPVHHTVPAVGLLVSDDSSSLLYSGDTGPTEAIWKEANKTPNLKALMIEASYPDRLKERALISGHLTPHLLAGELDKIDFKQGMLVFVYHLKPPYVDEIKKEICELKIDNLVLLEEGDTYGLV